MTNPQTITIHEFGEIDIHNRQNNFRKALERLKANKSIDPTNKKLILEFIRDCQLGKTIKRKSKKRIGHAAGGQLSSSSHNLRLIVQFTSGLSSQKNKKPTPEGSTLISPYRGLSEPNVG